MELDFLFWFFLVGILIALGQDLKRREIDNWLNYFLLVGSFSFIFFKIIFERNFSLIFNSILVLVLVFILMNAFYYGRVFGGGDAFLLFAMSALFVSVDFWMSVINVGIFVILLMISGSFYGAMYSVFLYSVNFQNTNKELKKNFNKNKKMIFISILFSACLFVLSYFYVISLFFAIIFFLFPFLYVFAKGLEKVSMIKVISGKNLREGDWLVNDEKVGNRIIKSNWEGLSEDEIKILKRKKRVLIKEGIPFVPAFLVAFILYVLGRELILEILGIMI